MNSNCLPLHCWGWRLLLPFLEWNIYHGHILSPFHYISFALNSVTSPWLHPSPQRISLFVLNLPYLWGTIAHRHHATRLITLYDTIFTLATFWTNPSLKATPTTFLLSIPWCIQSHWTLNTSCLIPMSCWQKMPCLMLLVLLPALKGWVYHTF